MIDRTVLIILVIGLIAAAVMFFPKGLSSPFATKEIPGMKDPMLEMSIDKEIYHSGDRMEMNISLPPENGKMVLKVYGVKDSRGDYRINEERDITIDALNDMTKLDFNLPSCYGCAGVAEGNYTIICELLSNNTVIYNTTKIIELRK